MKLGASPKRPKLYIQLEQVGALARVRHYMVTHQEGVPQFDMLQAAKALRCYAGVLSLVAGAIGLSGLSGSPESWIGSDG